MTRSKTDNARARAFPGLGESGLTKREYFAALAMQAEMHFGQGPEEAAKAAVAHADALLAALGEGEGE